MKAEKHVPVQQELSLADAVQPGEAEGARQQSAVQTEGSQARSRRRRRQRFLSVLTDLYVVLMYTLFYIPVAVMIVFSFNDAKRNFSWEGFTTAWYRKLFSFSNTTLWDALIYSLVIAVLATVISTVIGVLGGIGLKKFEFRTKKFINMMIYVPIIVPDFPRDAGDH